MLSSLCVIIPRRSY